jgi:hypothetical protein
VIPITSRDRFTTGRGTGATASAWSSFRSAGMVLTSLFSASSHVTTSPLYTAIRPMIAVRVLSATACNSFAGLPSRMLRIRSMCSST